MALIELNKNPGNRELFVFGALWLLFLTFLTTICWLDKRIFLSIFLALVAFGVPAIGLIYRPFIKIVYLGTSYITYPIGYILSHIILIVIYYLIFTLMSLLIKLLRIDPMNRTWKADAQSYWTEHKGPNKLKSYFHQY